MQVGLIGAGNVARALARGWGDPVLVSDSGSGRARALVDELAGEALQSNVEVAERADLVVLCHKPAQFGAVARELKGHAKAVASVVGGVDTKDAFDAVVEWSR
jgi:pyrroline-5-carboxylate reductase